MMPFVLVSTTSESNARELMKQFKIKITTSLLIAAFLLSGCGRNSGEIWDDTKTCGKHLTRGVYALGGKRSDMGQGLSPDEFYWPADGQYTQTESYNQGYFTVPDDLASNEIAMADYVAPQPKDSPGDPGSPVPGIDQFRDPATMSGMGNIFQTIHFEYNSSLLKGTHNQETIQKIANYMKSNPRVYLFVEGHCDQRGAEAYNLALGSRRANSVRNILIKEGVSPDNLFTISYGKERPIAYENSEEGWSLNRRAEFKIYVR